MEKKQDSTTAGALVTNDEVSAEELLGTVLWVTLGAPIFILISSGALLLCALPLLGS